MRIGEGGGQGKRVEREDSGERGREWEGNLAPTVNFLNVDAYGSRAVTSPTLHLVSKTFPCSPGSIGGSPFGYKEQRCWANSLCN